MTFATFAIANMLVSGSALVLAVGLRFRGAIEMALAAAVIALSQVTASILIAGVVLRHLNATSLLLINAALTSGVFLIVRPSIRSPRKWPTLGGVMKAGGGAARAHPLAAALAALAAAALGWRVVLAIVLPPYAFDALSYHLPTVAHWISRGRIEESPLNDCCAGYPAGGEAVFTWPAILLDGDSAVDAVQIGFAVLAALAVAGLARVACLRRSSAVTAAALFALTPIVLAQANTNYVDVISAATFLVALFFVAT